MRMQSSKWVAFAQATSPLSLVAWMATTAGCGATGTASVGSGSSTGAATTGSGGSGLVTSGSAASGSGGSGLVTSGSATAGSGSGASTTGAGSNATSVCAGPGTRVLTSTDTFIDDFEETMLLPGWYSFNDIPGMPDSFKLMQTAPGAAGTAHAGHYAGMGARTPTAVPSGYGVGATFNLVIDPSAGLYCVDISVFDGISFWAKAATASTTISLNFVVPQTNKATMDMMMRPNGGDCTVNCYNHPHVNFALMTTWKQYTATFAVAGGGSAKVANLIQEIVFISPDSNWDFSIDEIAYFKGTPPTGAIGRGDGGP